MSVRENFPLPAFLQEEYRRAKDAPEVVAREAAVLAEKERREALAADRRDRLWYLRDHHEFTELDLECWWDEMARRDDERHR
jgi:hypothetical protein